MTIVPAKLHHVSRQTQRLDETRQFYVDVLGFREISRPPFSFRGAWLYGAGIQMHLIEATFEAPDMAINGRENHIAFAVEDMDGAEELLKQRGIHYKRNVVPERGTNQIFFRDPDGWLIELGLYPAVMDR
ncbi:MAG TPA: VOC family protein [Bryobacteraceae bacterium]|nr:VOC family protein [Bryobacteraceae bacterium]